MPFHVLTAEFLHESNTFKKGTTTLRDFAAHVLYDGEAGLGSRLGANTEISGFMTVAKAENWTTTHVISAHAEPGGKVAREAYEHIAGKICAAVQTHRGQLDGILLALHGAMVTEDHQDGEGELLSRIRAITGPDLPIAITLDLHANATAAMARLADIVVAFKTYPHIDMTLTGTQAARLLHDRMAGKTKPHTLRTHRPMLDDTNAGRSDAGPIVPLYVAARAHETEPTFGGGPLTLTGTIRAISDGQITGDGPMMGGQHLNFGPTAVFRVGGIDILVVTERGQMLDQQQFRAAFEPIAARVIVCDCGALSTPQMHRRPYVNALRPIYPLDPDMVLTDGFDR